jgi:hypothetical protein
MSFVRPLLLLFVLLLAGCSFVQPSKSGANVRVATAEQVGSCQRLGQTTVSTLARVGGLPRYESSIQEELNTLARNSAADMGGDTVVPVEPVKEGKQTFIIYRCQPAAQ